MLFYALVLPSYGSVSGHILLSLKFSSRDFARRQGETQSGRSVKQRCQVVVDRKSVRSKDNFLHGATQWRSNLRNFAALSGLEYGEAFL